MQLAGLSDAVALIRESGYFDEPWYVGQFADVTAVGLDPVLHYLWLGWRLGRSPGRAFDGPWYLAHNPDVAASDVNPLLHYLRYGQLEGRAVRPLADGIGPPRAAQAGAPAAPVGRVIRTQLHAGERTHVDGAASVLLCAHASGRQIFGGERSVLDLLDAMAALSLNVVVTLPSDENPEYLAELRRRARAVHVFAYPQWVGDRPLDEARVLVFAELVARYGIDLVHANTIMLPEPLVAARRMGRVAVAHAREIITRDSALADRIGLPAQEIVARVLARTDAVIANSRATAAEYQRPGRTFHVPNAIDPDAFDLGNPVDGPVRFALISSNVAKKGVADVIDVARACAGRVDNARFLVIGPRTPLIEDCIAAQERGEVPHSVEFLDYRDSPRDAIAEANVVLSLSGFAESFGRTVAEAQVARRPVIAYDHGAVPELVEDGVTGLLAPFRDVAAVAEHVVALCREPARIAVMGEAGRARMQATVVPARLQAALGEAYAALLERPLATTTTASPAEWAPPPAPPVTVVVPIFDAFEVVQVCLASLLRHTDPAAARVLLIDDASTDPRIRTLLDDIGRRAGVEVLRNAVNLGYTRTVNRGLDEAGTHDVVLLNSDTIVSPQWLQGLRASAYAAPRIGTVTAMSDNAGAFSFPREGQANPKPAHVSHDDYAATLVQAAAGLPLIDVPTGSGFCLYLRRALLDQVGGFDAEAFPRGYGEENDLCMRGLQAGWRNVLTPWAFVFHVRSASFGASREALVQSGLQVVTRRYPDYLAQVRSAFAAPAMQALRAATAAAATALPDGSNAQSIT